ncbi:hypothetical protein DPSP01_007807 [Paraphaeosphaeria sporulosa]
MLGVSTASETSPVLPCCGGAYDVYFTSLTLLRRQRKIHDPRHRDDAPLPTRQDLLESWDRSLTDPPSFLNFWKPLLSPNILYCHTDFASLRHTRHDHEAVRHDCRFPAYRKAHIHRLVSRRLRLSR